MTEGKVSEAEGRLHTGSWEDVVLWENQHATQVAVCVSQETFWLQREMRKKFLPTCLL